ncbi:unnamed protein product [Parnassius mnemosyne]|uniref:FLYWCH-type domain-containing protein n=1 Tax=Parnassius mnemosyne TaxID=213953 RepID=A0AAV1K8H6_9NEOP
MSSSQSATRSDLLREVYSEYKNNPEKDFYVYNYRVMSSSSSLQPFTSPLLNIGLPQRMPQSTVLSHLHPSTSCISNQVVTPSSGGTPYTSPAVMWVRKKDGKQLAIVDGFTFYVDGRTKNNVTWRCTSGHFCRARFVVDNNFLVIRSNLIHAHAPPRYVLRNGSHDWTNVSTVQWVRKSCGKQLAILDGFTYYLDGKSNLTTTWRCTSAGPCKARFVMSNHVMQIIRGNLNHSHKKPTYVIRNGIFFKT